MSPLSHLYLQSDMLMDDNGDKNVLVLQIYTSLCICNCLHGFIKTVKLNRGN